MKTDSMNAPTNESTADAEDGGGTESVLPPVDLERRRRLRTLLQRQGLLAMLIALIVFFTIQSPYFFTSSNFFTIAAGATVLATMAASQTFLIVSGGFDVSVGSTVAMSTVLFGILNENELPTPIIIALVLLMGAGIGAANGFIVVQLNVNPLIATLGTMSIFAGLAFIFSSGQTQVVRNDFLRWLTTTKFGPVPVLVVGFAIIYIIAMTVERLTITGRRVYAIGGNPEAARLAGLPVQRISFLLYVVSAMSAALAGIFLTGILGSASPQVGSTFLLSVVTAVILGGASLAGGQGSILGTLVAVAILGVLQNGFALMALPAYAQTVALGVALIVAVLIDGATRRLEK